jgi:beta-mannosidase
VAVLADAWSDTVAVWVAADEPVQGHLEVRVLSFQGTTLAMRAADVSASGERASLAWREPVGSLLPEGTDPRSVVVEASFTTRGGATFRDLEFLVPPRLLALSDPAVRILEVSPQADGWRVSLTADRLAYGVRLTLEGVGARFSENFFHLLAGDTATVRVTPETPVPDLPARLRLRTLWTGRIRS